MTTKQKYNTGRRMRGSKYTSSSDDSYKISILGRLINPYEYIARNVPKGYNMKHYYVGEFPIVLMGSVFDPYSLGKWMYDWAVYLWGTDNEDTECVEDLWLILIRWTASLKRLTVLQEYILPTDWCIELAQHQGYGLSLRDELSSLIYLLGLSCQLTSNISTNSPTSVSAEQLLNTMFRSIDQGRLTTKLLSRMSSWTAKCDATCLECEQFIREQRG